MLCKYLLKFLENSQIEKQLSAASMKSFTSPQSTCVVPPCDKHVKPCSRLRWDLLALHLALTLILLLLPFGNEPSIVLNLEKAICTVCLNY